MLNNTTKDKKGFCNIVFSYLRNEDILVENILQSLPMLGSNCHILPDAGEEKSSYWRSLGKF